MKTLLGIVLGYFLYAGVILSHACATTGGQKVTSCAEAVASDAGKNLLPAVGAILDSGDYAAGLAGLAVQYGSEFVTCLVQQFVPTVGTAEVTPRAAHAVEWVKAHGVSR